MNPQAMMKQLEQMQAQMAESSIADQMFTASAGGGMVTVTGNGDGQLTDVTINPEILDPEEVELVQDMVMAAVNDLASQIAEAERGRIDEMTKGLNLPPGYPTDMLG